jgi:hypothetical protein
MRRRFARLSRPRLKGLKIDWLAAGLLTLGLELEVRLGTGASHALPVALLGAVVTTAAPTRRLADGGRHEGGLRRSLEE